MLRFFTENLDILTKEIIVAEAAFFLFLLGFPHEHFNQLLSNIHDEV